jgi:hypothetical protein
MHTEVRLEPRMTSKTNYHVMLLRRRCDARWTSVAGQKKKNVLLTSAKSGFHEI